MAAVIPPLYGGFSCSVSRNHHLVTPGCRNSYVINQGSTFSVELWREISVPSR